MAVLPTNRTESNTDAEHVADHNELHDGHNLSETHRAAAAPHAGHATDAELTTVSTALTTHEADTTNVHGIADTTVLDTVALRDTAIATHEADTTAVHGFTNTVLAREIVATFSKSGALAVAAGTHRWYADKAYTIVSVTAGVGTAPTGATLIVDVNNNGTSVWNVTTANRPTIAISGFTATGGALDDTTLAAGEYLTVDIDQVGSTVAGSDLVVNIVLRCA